MEDRLEELLMERLVEQQGYIRFLEDKIQFLQGKLSISVVVNERDLRDYAHCQFFHDESCRNSPCIDCNLMSASRV